MAHNGGPRSCVGRNTKKCAMYRMLRKHERSHIERIEKHIEKYKDKSKMATQALNKYRLTLKERHETR